MKYVVPCLAAMVYTMLSSAIVMPCHWSIVTSLPFMSVTPFPFFFPCVLHLQDDEDDEDDKKSPSHKPYFKFVGGR